MSDDARSAILERMRRALGRNEAAEATARQQVMARLATPAPTLVPARADLDQEARVRLFVEQAEAVQTRVQRVGTFDQLPAAIAAHLRRHDLPTCLTVAIDPWIDQADWTASSLDVRRGPPSVEDPVGLTTAFAGIAETGTLMLVSDQAHPTTLAFLPETSIVVLPTERVCRAYEDALHGFRATAPLPRSINLITGPSRSGDIEQTLQLGAHGPKHLLTLLVDQSTGAGTVADIRPPPTG